MKIKLKAARELSKTLLKMAKQIGNRTPAGLYLRALSSVSNTKYEIVHSKFESVDFFCGQKSNVDMTELFDSINQRRKEIASYCSNFILEPYPYLSITLHLYIFPNYKNPFRDKMIWISL